ncbi:hypothetical protein [Geodermatophilus sp. URMC 62]|uniref:hypothetical protein n=1 Tax=Geodermatophilus sp. URMC 62 TaxID=3423414 RepID=UPI00406CB146
MLACWFGMSRSTITRAVGEVRPRPGRPRVPCGRPPSPPNGHSARSDEGLHKFAAGVAGRSEVEPG